MAWNYDENHIPDLGHLKDVAERAHGDIQNLAELVIGTLEDMIIQETLSIATSAWSENTDATTLAAGYAYKADISVTGLIENANVNITLSPMSLEIARAAGMCPTAIGSAGSVRFLARRVPLDDITGTLDAIQLDDGET